MLQSVMDNWTEISQCVHKSIKPKVDRLDLTLLTDLTVYLKKCYDLRISLCSQSEPTFDKVFPARFSLEACRTLLVGSLAPLQEHFVTFIEEKVKVKIIKGTFLYISQ